MLVIVVVIRGTCGRLGRARCPARGRRCGGTGRAGGRRRRGLLFRRDAAVAIGPLWHVRRLRELLNLHARGGLLHVSKPYLGGERSSSNAVVVLAEGSENLLLAVRADLVHVHDRDHLRDIADKPRGPGSGRRSRLAGDRPAEGTRSRTRSVALGHRLQGVVELVHRLLFERPLSSRRTLVLRLAFSVLDRAHNVRGGGHPLIGEGRIAFGHVDRAGRGRAEDVRQVVVQSRRRIGNPRFNSSLPGVRGTHGVVELGEDGVDRMLRRSDEVDPAAVLSVEVLNGDRAVVERSGSLRIVCLRERIVLLERGEQTKRFEGGTRLRAVLRHRVALAREVVRAAVHRIDFTVPRVDRDEADVVVLRPVLGQPVDGRHRGVLLVLVDRRHNLQTALIEVVEGELAAREELVAHRGKEVSVGAFEGRGLLALNRFGELLGLSVRFAQVPLADHSVEDAVPLFFRFLGVDGGIVNRGTGNDADEQRGLRNGELARRNAEVLLGSHFDSVGSATKVDGVEIVFEDLVLRLLLVDFYGQDGFFDLAQIPFRAAEIVTLDVLLGQGGAALPRTAFDVVDERAEDALRGDAVVRVESRVLGGHERVRKMLRQRLQFDGFAFVVRECPHLCHAVGIVDGGGLRQGEIVRLGNFCGGVQRDEGPDEQGEHRDEGREDDPPAGDPPMNRPVSPSGIVPAALALGLPFASSFGVLGRLCGTPLRQLVRSCLCVLVSPHVSGSGGHRTSRVLSRNRNGSVRHLVYRGLFGLFLRLS